MLHFVINKSEESAETTDKVVNFFQYFLQYIKQIELLTINIAPIDLSITATSYFPSSYVKHLYRDQERIVINNLDVAYGKPLDFLIKLKEKLVEVASDADKEKDEIDFQILTTIVNRFLRISVSCRSIEEAIALDKATDKDAFKSCIVVLFSEEEDREIEGIKIHNIKESKLVTITTSLYDFIFKLISNEN